MENSNGVCLSGELKMSSGIRTLMNTEVLYDMSALPFLCIFRPDIPLTLTSYNFRTNLPFPIISSSVLQHPWRTLSVNTHFITFKTSELLHRCIYLILIPRYKEYNTHLFFILHLVSARDTNISPRALGPYTGCYMGNSIYCYIYYILVITCRKSKRFCLFITNNFNSKYGIHS